MSLTAALILLAVIAIAIGVSLRGPRAGRGSSSGAGGADHAPWYALGFFGSGGSDGHGGGGFDGGGGGGDGGAG